MAYVLLATAAASTLIVWQGKQLVAERKNDAAVFAARQLAQVTETLAGRIAELQDQFTIAYPSGAPTTDLLWLKDPDQCTISGIPPKPNRADGTPIVESFLPCDFPDINESGNPYVISWTGTWPNIIAKVHVGDPTQPFEFQGEVNGRYGGLIAQKANAITSGGREDGMHRIYVSYQYDPDNNILAGIADNTSPVPIRPEVDPLALHRDGSTTMNNGARIKWEGSTAWVGHQGNRAYLSGTDASVWADASLQLNGGMRIDAVAGAGGAYFTSNGGEVRVTSYGGNAVVESSNVTTIYGEKGLNLQTSNQAYPIKVNTGLTATYTIKSDSGNIEAGVDVKAGRDVIAAGSVKGSQFVPGIKNEGGICDSLGAFAAAADGSMLNCIGGKWKKANSAPRYTEGKYLQVYNGQIFGPYALCTFAGFSGADTSCLMSLESGPDAEGKFKYKAYNRQSERCYVNCYN